MTPTTRAGMPTPGYERGGVYQPPIIYFGGKSAVAGLVWDALGDCKNYVEPFFGSGAVLFLRPQVGAIETVNDADGLLANFWRALQRDPDAVADAADNPVNEGDLHARHLWLLGQRDRITERLMGDPDFYDAKAAGWWAWGLNCWIGSGWCSGRGPWVEENGVMVLRNTGNGVNRQRPDLGGGKGVKRQRPHLGDAGNGVNRKLPHLGGGRGVNRKRPHLGDAAGGGECAERRAWLIGYLRGFADRLRNVRVCCGDWSRVCGPCVTFKHGVTGVFLDPPYADTANRTAGLYAVDCQAVAHQAREWALAHGTNPLLRIVLAGYSEHESLESHGWSVARWEARGGYGLQGKKEGLGNTNKTRETLYFSPHCLKTSDDLFNAAGQRVSNEE